MSSISMLLFHSIWQLLLCIWERCWFRPFQWNIFTDVLRFKFTILLLVFYFSYSFSSFCSLFWIHFEYYLWFYLSPCGLTSYNSLICYFTLALEFEVYISPLTLSTFKWHTISCVVWKPNKNTLPFLHLFSYFCHSFYFYV